MSFEPPTPMGFSRCSSMTSLNSFDVKSIHSTVNSEYSMAATRLHSNVTSPSLNDTANAARAEAVDSLEDELDKLMPESPADANNSFKTAQRIKHKQQQFFCRQTAALMAAMTLKNCDSDSADSASDNSTPSMPILLPMSTSIIKNELTTTHKQQQPQTVAAAATAYMSHTPPIKLLSNYKQQIEQQQQQPPMPNYSFLRSATKPPPPPLPLPSNQPNKMLVYYDFLKQANASNFAPVESSHQPSQVPRFLQSYSNLNYQQQIANDQSKNSNSSSSGGSSICFGEINVVANHSSSMPTMQTTSAVIDASIGPRSKYPSMNLFPMALLNNQHSNTPNSTYSLSSVSSLAQFPSSNASCSSLSSIDEMPHVYSSEKSLKYNNNDRNQCSPQESICSRMSCMSVPSIIREDISEQKSHFNALVHSITNESGGDGGGTQMTTARDLLAKFGASKMMNNNNHHNHQLNMTMSTNDNTLMAAAHNRSLSNQPTPLASMSMNIEQPNENEEDDDEKPKNFYTEEESALNDTTPQDKEDENVQKNRLLTAPSSAIAAATIGRLQQHHHHQHQQHNTPRIFIDQTEADSFNEESIHNNRNRPDEDSTNDIISYNQEELSCDSFNAINMHQNYHASDNDDKPLNTPAAEFGSFSSASLLMNESSSSSSNEQENFRSQTMRNSQRKQQDLLVPKQTPTFERKSFAVDKESDDADVDDDLILQNFIDEMLPQINSIKQAESESFNHESFKISEINMAAKPPKQITAVKRNSLSSVQTQSTTKNGVGASSMIKFPKRTSINCHYNNQNHDSIIDYHYSHAQQSHNHDSTTSSSADTTSSSLSQFQQHHDERQQQQQTKFCYSNQTYQSSNQMKLNVKKRLSVETASSVPMSMKQSSNLSPRMPRVATNANTNKLIGTVNNKQQGKAVTANQSLLPARSSIAASAAATKTSNSTAINTAKVANKLPTTKTATSTSVALKSTSVRKAATTTAANSFQVKPWSNNQSINKQPKISSSTNVAPSAIGKPKLLSTKSIAPPLKAADLNETQSIKKTTAAATAPVPARRRSFGFDNNKLSALARPSSALVTINKQSSNIASRPAAVTATTQVAKSSATAAASAALNNSSRFR